MEIIKVSSALEADLMTIQVHVRTIYFSFNQMIIILELF